LLDLPIYLIIFISMYGEAEGILTVGYELLDFDYKEHSISRIF